MKKIFFVGPQSPQKLFFPYKYDQAIGLIKIFDQIKSGNQGVLYYHDLSYGEILSGAWLAKKRRLNMHLITKVQKHHNNFPNWFSDNFYGS